MLMDNQAHFDDNRANGNTGTGTTTRTALPEPARSAFSCWNPSQLYCHSTHQGGLDAQFDTLA